MTIKQKSLLTFCLVLLTISPSLGSSGTTNVVVLKNENNFIPIKKLETLKIASVWVGESKSSEAFQAYLSRYTLVQHFLFLPQNKAHLQRMKLSLRNDFTTVIIAIDSSATLNEIELAKQWLGDLASVNFILCIQENTRAEATDLVKAATILVSKAADFWKIPQVIFGGMNANGKLQESIGNYPKGTGLEVKALQRLSYVTPSEIGLNESEFQPKIDSVCNTAIALGAFPGCQVMSVYKGQVFFHKTYGYHTYRQKRAVQHDDLYDLASVSKVTTALAALMKFHGEGIFQLDKTMGDFFPFLRNSNKKDLVMRDVLAHQARLKPWIPYWQSTVKEDGSFKPRTLRSSYSKKYPIKLTDHLFLHKNYRKRQIYKAIKKSPLLEKKEYVYSGLSFYLYPELVERLTGTDYETYLKKTFYEPLGAYRLTFNPMRFWEKETIIPTENDTFFRKEQLQGIVHDEGAAMMNGFSANAGLFGTADDLAKLFQMYLQMGEFAGKQYIAAESVKEFTRYQFEGNRRGLGFDKPPLENKENGSVSVLASNASFGHSGYTGTFVWADPDKEFIFIFLSNRVYPTRENSIIYQENIRPTLNHIFYEALGAID